LSGFDISALPSDRDDVAGYSRRSSELATKLIKLILKPSRLSIKDLNDPLAQVPEVVKRHLL
jgi:hypothetical protein